MRRIWLALFFSQVVFPLFSQQPDTTVSNPKVDVQIPPSYPGGEAALMDYLYAQLNPPEPGLCNDRGGEARFTFVIEKDGSVSNIQVVNSLCPKFDSLAMRALSNMPRWEPGSSNGNPVRVRYTLPLRFHPPEKSGQTQSKPTHISGGATVAGGAAMNLGSLGTHVKPAGMVDINAFFGGEKMAFEIGTTWLFSKVKEPFESNGYWADERGVSIVSGGLSLRRRFWHQERQDLAIRAGIAFYLFLPMTSENSDPEEFKDQSFAPWLGVSHHLLLKERVKKNFLNRTRLQIQLKWCPLFFDEPIRGSYLSLGVGMEWSQQAIIR